MRKVRFKGFIETSFIDWPRQLSSVVFTGGCNFRCPYCHNKDLVLNPGGIQDIPLAHIITTLKRYKKWVERIVITGGEPTIHKDLFPVVETIKKEGVFVKLDTNGSNPAVLKELVGAGLVDYIAMDVKGPLSRYERWCGTGINADIIADSIAFIMEKAPDYEFRMTVVPFLHTEKDVYEVAEYIKNAKRFSIQGFKPNNTLDSSFSHITPFPPDKMANIRKNVLDYLAGNRVCSA